MASCRYELFQPHIILNMSLETAIYLSKGSADIPFGNHTAGENPKEHYVLFDCG